MSGLTRRLRVWRWNRLARACDKASRTGNRRPWMEGMGLCWAVFHGNPWWFARKDLEALMRHAPKWSGDYWFTRDAEGDRARARLARRIATEIEIGSEA